jgi:hypothetical protein
MRILVQQSTYLNHIGILNCHTIKPIFNSEIFSKRSSNRVWLLTCSDSTNGTNKINIFLVILHQTHGMIMSPLFHYHISLLSSSLSYHIYILFCAPYKLLVLGIVKKIISSITQRSHKVLFYFGMN